MPEVGETSNDGPFVRNYTVAWSWYGTEKLTQTHRHKGTGRLQVQLSQFADE